MPVWLDRCAVTVVVNKVKLATCSLGTQSITARVTTLQALLRRCLAVDILAEADKRLALRLGQVRLPQQRLAGHRLQRVSWPSLQPGRPMFTKKMGLNCASDHTSA